MSDYKFVTLEDYLEANQHGKEILFFKALAERDAFREVAIQDEYHYFQEYDGTDNLEQAEKFVDAEAARILEEKK